MTVTVQIGEAARQAGVSLDTIRFYQKLGLIQCPSRSAGGYRLFDEKQIHDLAFIRHAQELGFSLNQVKELLALRQKPHACAQVQNMLAASLADVRERIRSLTGLELELGRALRNCNRELHDKRGVKHQDCCPLLTTLERVNGAEKRNGVGRKKRANK